MLECAISLTLLFAGLFFGGTAYWLQYHDPFVGEDAWYQFLGSQAALWTAVLVGSPLVGYLYYRAVDGDPEAVTVLRYVSVFLGPLLLTSLVSVAVTYGRNDGY